VGGPRWGRRRGGGSAGHPGRGRARGPGAGGGEGVRRKPPRQATATKGRVRRTWSRGVDKGRRAFERKAGPAARKRRRQRHALARRGDQIRAQRRARTILGQGVGRTKESAAKQRWPRHSKWRGARSHLKAVASAGKAQRRWRAVVEWRPGRQRLEERPGPSAGLWVGHRGVYGKDKGRACGGAVAS